MTPAEDRDRILDLIAEAQAAGASLQACCESLGVSAKTVGRWQRARNVGSQVDGRAAAASKRMPIQKLKEEEVEKILEILKSSEFRDMSPNQIVPILADRGIYIASESTMYRILRRHDLLARRGRAAAPFRRAKPTFTATAPKQVWSWDITYMPSLVQGQFYKLYMMIDVYSRKIVGWEVHPDENAEHASELLERAVMREGVSRDSIRLHSDNGSPMKGSTMLATMKRLGVTPSFSRPRVSNDNPFSESLFRTLKYRPAWPREPFASIDEARRWVAQFVEWYNTKHRHSGIRYTTPNERHEGRDEEILRKRSEVYNQARKARPARWSRRLRNWSPIRVVRLNPENGLEQAKGATKRRCRCDEGRVVAAGRATTQRAAPSMGRDEPKEKVG